MKNLPKIAVPFVMAASLIACAENPNEKLSKFGINSVPQSATGSDLAELFKGNTPRYYRYEADKDTGVVPLDVAYCNKDKMIIDAAGDDIVGEPDRVTSRDCSKGGMLFQHR